MKAAYNKSTWDEFTFYCRMHYLNYTGQYDIDNEFITFYSSSLYEVYNDFIAKHGE